VEAPPSCAAAWMSWQWMAQTCAVRLLWLYQNILQAGEGNASMAQSLLLWRVVLSLQWCKPVSRDGLWQRISRCFFGAPCVAGCFIFGGEACKDQVAGDFELHDYSHQTAGGTLYCNMTHGTVLCV
jgi:hypothetical protein